MASVPPSYTNDSPPSYDEVVKKLDGLIGSNRTATGVLDAAEKLTQQDLDILSDNFDSHFPISSDADKVNFTKGLTLTSCSNEVAGLLNASAADASETAAQIRASFQGLEAKLGQVDTRFGTTWVTELRVLKQAFQSCLDDSRSVAVRSNVHGELFDDDVKFCGNSTKTVDERITRIERGETRGSGLLTEGEDINNRLDQLITDFRAFINKFVAWANGKEGDLSDELRRIKQDLIDLDKKLADLQIAYDAVSHLAQGVTPIIGPLAAAFPPFSTVIAIGGLIFAGLSLAATTGLLVGIGAVKRDIAAKTKAKAELEKDLEFIREARETVEQTGTVSVSSFKTCISSMPLLATSSVADAGEIKAWLRRGAKDEDRPFYLIENSVNSVRSYEAMGVYLHKYGAGIASICTPETVEKE